MQATRGTLRRARLLTLRLFHRAAIGPTRTMPATVETP